MQIYYSPLTKDNSSGDYYLTKKEVCRNSERWNGNVYQYLFDMWDYDEACPSINGEYDGIIYNLPQKAVVMSWARIPVYVYWCE